MEEINIILADALDKYFTLLSKTGQSHYDEPILVLAAIQFILENFAEFVTEEDLRHLINVISCIQGSCLIPLKSDITDDTLFRGILGDLEIRVTEEDNYRNTEDYYFRVLEGISIAGSKLE